MSGKWASSNRRSELPANWPSLRLEVKRRALGRCQADTHEPDCSGIGTDCDHIGDRHDHSLTNLQWLSKPCHKAKTQREAKRPPRTRPKPQHPGVIA